MESTCRHVTLTRNHSASVCNLLVATHFVSKWPSLTDSVYDPPSGRAEPAVPLSQGGGIFTIGYSSGSWRPFTPPKLCEGQTIHVGFLKLFFFTQFVSSEQQIRSTRPYASRGVKSRSRQAHTTTPHPLSTWDAIVIPVVQHLNLTGHTLHSLPLASQWFYIHPRSFSILAILILVFVKQRHYTLYVA